MLDHLIAGKILGGIKQLKEVTCGILTHHERLDGKGYPCGLAGGELPIEGRILGLADALDAMTSQRTYRDALPLAQAIEEIRRHTGTQFDADIVEKLLEMDMEVFMAEIHQPTDATLPAGIFEGVRQ